MQCGASRIPGGGVWDSRQKASRIPEVWPAVLHRVGYLFFPWEGLAFLKKNCCCGIELYPSTGSPAANPPCLSTVPSTPDSSCVTPVCGTLPSPEPKVSGSKWETCAVASRRGSGGGGGGLEIVALFPGSFPSRWKYCSISPLDAT